MGTPDTTRPASGPGAVQEPAAIAPLSRRARFETALFRLGVTPVQLVAGLVVVAAGGVIAWALLTPPAVPLDVRIPTVTVPPPTTTAPQPLAVHAAGAVVSPGLYRLPPGARVVDLIEAAGGPALDADLDRVNLAAPLEDGWQVHVPRMGETAPPLLGPGAGGSAGGGSGGGSGGGAGGPIDLNSATAEELEALPGVGPSIAAAIVGHRDEQGGFGSVEDLLDVPGIGPSRFENLRDLVVVR